MTLASETTALWCHTDDHAQRQIQRLIAHSVLALSVKTLLLGGDARVFSSIPSSTLHEASACCPNMRSMEFYNSLPELSTPLRMHPQHVFQNLDSLSVNFPMNVINYRATTTALFDLFADMPALKRLVLWDMMDGPQEEYDAHLVDLPTPAFSLTCFWFCGLISVRSASTIILASKNTLSELYIFLPSGLPDHDDSALYAAIAEAAPLLQNFRFRADSTSVSQDALVSALRAVCPHLEKLKLLMICLNPSLKCASVAELISLIPSQTPIRALCLRHLDARDFANDLSRLLELEPLRILHALALHIGAGTPRLTDSELDDLAAVCRKRRIQLDI